VSRRVALATSERWPELSADDSGLSGELRTFGVETTPAVWTDERVDWRTFDLVVVRSCWDYHLRIDEFRAWIDRLERDHVRLLNPPSVLRWNMHKRYLLELESKGIPIPKTRLIEDGGDVVAKPAISASAHATQRMSGDIIIQEFVAEVLEKGEWSLMFFDRVFSHAVKKLPKSGDFRVQEELGGASTPMKPPAHVLDAAGRVLAQMTDDDILYARIDWSNASTPSSSWNWSSSSRRCSSPRMWLLHVTLRPRSPLESRGDDSLRLPERAPPVLEEACSGNDHRRPRQDHRPLAGQPRYRA
jgi:hypothetical protein